jgi:hypothetical protein
MTALRASFGQSGGRAKNTFKKVWGHNPENVGKNIPEFSAGLISVGFIEQYVSICGEG